MNSRKLYTSVLFGIFCFTLHKTWSQEAALLTPVPGYALPTAIKTIEPTEFNPEELPSALDYARTITDDALVIAPSESTEKPSVAKVIKSKNKRLAKKHRKLHLTKQSRKSLAMR